MTLNYPFAIISDVHLNDWSQFSYITEEGLNSRLVETLDAIKLVAKAIEEFGSKQIVITGDLYHTRGKMKPSVFNPTYKLFSDLCAEGFEVFYLCGNHDLETKDSNWISDAVYAFSEIPNFHVFNKVSEVGNFVFLPWIEYKDDFVNIVGNIESPNDKVVFCHIGIDGVLDKVAGKVGKAVLNRGFKYVFSGDYHNHKDLGNGIYSVGALSHHSFSDIGSTAGFLIVTEDEVIHRETKAPKFVEGMSKHQTGGNIVRLMGEMTEEEAARKVKALYDYGAKHVQNLTTQPTIKSTSDSTVAVRVDLNIETALESYTKHKYGENYKAVLVEALRIKNEHV